MAVAKCSGTGKAKGVLSIENAVRRKKNAGQEALYFLYGGWRRTFLNGFEKRDWWSIHDK